jgi:hypothetical protein
MKTTLKIKVDSDPMHPREDCDNLGTIAYKHSRYVLGEEVIGDPIEWLEDMLNLKRGNIYTNERLSRLEELFMQKYVALPLYLFDHSGITISTKPFSCPWDSGKLGYIYVSKEKIYEEYGWKVITQKRRELILKYLQSEVNVFDDYVSGNVYCFEIIDKDGNVVDSCAGFFGTDWENNGMKEYVGEEYKHLLNDIEIEY